MGVEGGRDMGLSAMSLCTPQCISCTPAPCVLHHTAIPTVPCTPYCTHCTPYPQNPPPPAVCSAPLHSCTVCSAPYNYDTLHPDLCTGYHTVLSVPSNIQAALWILKPGFGILCAVSLLLGLHPAPSALQLCCRYFSYCPKRPK